MFVSDFVSHIWAPFVQEGDLQGLLDAIDIVVQRIPGICFMVTSLAEFRICHAAP